MNTMTFADGDCEERSRQEEEDDALPSSTTTNPEIVHKAHLPSGLRGDGRIALSFLLSDTEHRLVVLARKIIVFMERNTKFVGFVNFGVKAEPNPVGMQH